MTEYTLTQSDTQPENSHPHISAYDTFLSSFQSSDEPTFYERYCSGMAPQEIMEWEREPDDEFDGSELTDDAIEIQINLRFLTEGRALLRKIEFGLARLNIAIQDGSYVKKAIPASLRWRVFQSDGYQCVFCGSAEDLTADHIFSEVRGGPTILENLQTLCRPCNSKKGAY